MRLLRVAGALLVLAGLALILLFLSGAADAWPEENPPASRSPAS